MLIQFFRQINVKILNLNCIQISEGKHVNSCSTLSKISISWKVSYCKQRRSVWWDYWLSYQFMSVSGFIITWSVFTRGSCGPLISQLLNMVLNWNLLFNKWWWFVRWSRHWCVFQRLEMTSDNVSKIDK